MAKFSFRWGIEILDDSHTSIPNMMFDYYYLVPWVNKDGNSGTGISNTEWAFIGHLARYRYETEKSKASPSLTHTIRIKMGFKSNQGVINVQEKLEHKKLLTIKRQRGKRSEYNFSNFSKRILLIALQNDPDLLGEQEKQSTKIDQSTKLDSDSSSFVDSDSSTKLDSNKKVKEQNSKEEKNISKTKNILQADTALTEKPLTTTPPYHSFKQIEGNDEVKVCQACNLVWEVGTLAQMIDDKYSLSDKEVVDDARIYCSLEPGQPYQPTLPTPAESVQEMIEEDERFRSYVTGLIPTPPQSSPELSPPNQLKGITKVPLVNSQAQNIPHVRKLLPDFTSTSHFNLDALPSAHKWLPWNNGQYSQCGMCSLIKDGVSLGCYCLVINGELELFGSKEDLPTCGECLETVARCVAIIANLVYEFRSATTPATKTIATEAIKAKGVDEFSPPPSLPHPLAHHWERVDSKTETCTKCKLFYERDNKPPRFYFSLDYKMNEVSWKEVSHCSEAGDITDCYRVSGGNCGCGDDEDCPFESLAPQTIAIVGPPSTKTIATQMVAEIMAETRTKPVQEQQNLYLATEAPQRTLTDLPALYTPSSATVAESAPDSSPQVIPFDFVGGGGSGKKIYNGKGREKITRETVDKIRCLGKGISIANVPANDQAVHDAWGRMIDSRWSIAKSKNQLTIDKMNVIVVFMAVMNCPAPLDKATRNLWLKSAGQHLDIGFTVAELYQHYKALKAKWEADNRCWTLVGLKSLTGQLSGLKLLEGDAPHKDKPIKMGDNSAGTNLNIAIKM